MDKDLLDARINEVKAQNDARFLEVLGELRRIRENSITWKGVWGAAATSTIAIAGLILGVMAIGGDRFADGISSLGLLERIVESQMTRDQQQDERIDRILGGLERLEELSTEQGEAPRE